MRIGIDLDGCCYNFVKSVADYYRLTYGHYVTPQASCWEFYETDWGWTLDQFIEICNEGVDSNYIFRVGEPIPGSLEAIAALKEAGHTIHIVTDRSFGKKSHKSTERWLKEWGFPYDSLTYSKDKTIVKTDVFIDDRPANVNALRAAGVTAYLLNNGRDDQTDNPYLIVGWNEFVHLVNLVNCGRHDADFTEIPTPASWVDSSGNLLLGDSQGTPYMGEVSEQFLTEGEPLVDQWKAPIVRQFNTGATRDTDHGKLDYEGFLSPLVLHRYAKYMHKNRFQMDGTLRDSDNWQKGIPRTVYMKSLWRHFMSVWFNHRNASEECDWDMVEDDLCGVLFNVMGYLHEQLKERGNIDAGIQS